jgi:hypothetical protein
MTDNVRLAVLPESVKGIAATRQWIVDNAQQPQIIMIDDDFTFFKRKSDTDYHLELCQPEDTAAMITWIYDNLRKYPMVGISMRQGNNRKEGLVELNTAINGVLGIYVPTLNKCDIKFTDVEVMEDKHVGLALLTRGYENIVSYQYAYNQPASNTGGGCSTFRTPELQKAGAEKLHSLYPLFVKVVKKETTSSWWKGDRYDVTVQWKKAYKHGLQTRSAV